MGDYRITLKTGQVKVVPGDELVYSDKHVRIDKVQQHHRFGPRSFNNVVHTMIVLDSNLIDKIEEVI